MKTILPLLFVFAFLATSCRDKVPVSDSNPKEAVRAVSPEIGISTAATENRGFEVSSNVENETDAGLRLIRRSNAVADLIAAHQKISSDEIYAGQFRKFIAAETDAASIANLQDDLSEIRNDIRDTREAVPHLEKEAEEKSEPGDASYQLEIARYLADLAEATNTVARARRAQAANVKELEDILDKMHKVPAAEVISGNYPKLPN